MEKQVYFIMLAIFLEAIFSEGHTQNTYPEYMEYEQEKNEQENATTVQMCDKVVATDTSGTVFIELYPKDHMSDCFCVASVAPHQQLHITLNASGRFCPGVLQKLFVHMTGSEATDMCEVTARSAAMEPELFFNCSNEWKHLNVSYRPSVESRSVQSCASTTILVIKGTTSISCRRTNGTHVIDVTEATVTEHQSPLPSNSTTMTPSEGTHTPSEEYDEYCGFNASTMDAVTNTTTPTVNTASTMDAVTNTTTLTVKTTEPVTTRTIPSTANSDSTTVNETIISDDADVPQQLSKGLWIGIGIACAVIALVMVAVIFLMICSRRRKDQSSTILYDNGIENPLWDNTPQASPPPTPHKVRVTREENCKLDLENNEVKWQNHAPSSRPTAASVPGLDLLQGTDAQASPKHPSDICQSSPCLRSEEAQPTGTKSGSEEFLASDEVLSGELLSYIRKPLPYSSTSSLHKLQI